MTTAGDDHVTGQRRIRLTDLLGPGGSTRPTAGQPLWLNVIKIHKIHTSVVVGGGRGDSHGDSTIRRAEPNSAKEAHFGNNVATDAIAIGGL